ncbi:MAG TPA: DinB family protein [Candidatus Baltobacteraceae bacterium]|nr:DinB family protein [Candidatus Baltobacteraceae bacterium]
MQTLESKSDLDSILGRVSALAPSDARLWGKMSAHQMICHLCDSYKVALGEKFVSMATGFLQQTVIKYLALRLPMKWPKNSPTRPEVQQGVGGTAPAEFEEDRAELLGVIERFSGASFDRKIEHPFFGPMTREEWLRWGYLHADHHLRQFGR